MLTVDGDSERIMIIFLLGGFFFGQSLLGATKERGLCITEDDRAGLGLRCVPAPADVAQGSSEANERSSMLCLTLLLIPRRNFYFPTGNPAIANNAPKSRMGLLQTASSDLSME